MIRTDRLELVPLSVAAIADIGAGRRHSSWAADYPTPAETVWVHLAAESGGESGAGGEWGSWQIRWQSSGTVVGGAWFLGPPDEQGSVEIGYAVVTSQQGKGIATEVVAGLIDHARILGASCVIAATDRDNLASQAVLRTCAFEQWSGPADTATDSLWWRLPLTH